MHRREVLFGATVLTVPGVARAKGPIPSSWEQEWRETDFSKSSVPFDEIFSGGVPRDGIPALDGVDFAKGADLPGAEPVITVALGVGWRDGLGVGYWYDCRRAQRGRRACA